MDSVTHGLASYALCRALYPRAPRITVASVLVAGTVADLDRLSVFFGPSVYWAAHRTLSHSLLVSIVLPTIIAAVFIFTKIHLTGIGFWVVLENGGGTQADAAAAVKRMQKQFFFATPAVSTLAALLHVTLDMCQSEGVALLWPFRTTRFVLDWITGLDPWILAILLAGVLLPALFGLITEEIGARSKRPRGRAAAWLALAAVVAYLSARMILHADAVATLTARTYRGEPPRRAAAFPEAASLFTWHGLVETEIALHEVPVSVGPGAVFDPEAGTTIFKPEPSPLLDISGKTGTAREFLRVARFPKATIEKTESGYRFTLRDLRGAAAGDTRDAVAVLVELSPEAKILSQEILWERDLRNR